jgi:hypothetical protein
MSYEVAEYCAAQSLVVSDLIPSPASGVELKSDALSLVLIYSHWLLRC